MMTGTPPDWQPAWRPFTAHPALATAREG